MINDNIYNNANTGARLGQEPPEQGAAFNFIIIQLLYTENHVTLCLQHYKQHMLLLSKSYLLAGGEQSPPV